jgi:hypothetical protein
MRRRILSAILAGACMATSLVVGAAPAQAYFYPYKYEIKVNWSFKCVDVYNLSGDNGAPIQQWDCNNGWNQKWGFDYRGNSSTGDPVFKISSKNTYYQKCLDVVNGGTGWGTPVQQWDCSANTPQQYWIQEPYGELGSLPLYRYHAAYQPGLCLDISGQSLNNGARLQVWGCHNGFNQQFLNFADGAL